MKIILLISLLSLLVFCRQQTATTCNDHNADKSSVIKLPVITKSLDRYISDNQEEINDMGWSIIMYYDYDAYGYDYVILESTLFDYQENIDNQTSVIGWFEYNDIPIIVVRLAQNTVARYIDTVQLNKDFARFTSSFRGHIDPGGVIYKIIPPDSLIVNGITHGGFNPKSTCGL